MIIISFFVGRLEYCIRSKVLNYRFVQYDKLCYFQSFTASNDNESCFNHLTIHLLTRIISLTSLCIHYIDFLFIIQIIYMIYLAIFIEQKFYTMPSCLFICLYLEFLSCKYSIFKYHIHSVSVFHLYSFTK